MNLTLGLAGLAFLFVLLALQVPIAIAMMAIAFVGVWAMLGLAPAIGVLANTPYEFIASWTLSAVPMFLLMGFIAYHGGLTSGLFDAAKLGLRKVPGGLGIAAIVACSGFASVCGSSLATAASLGRIAIPEMVRAGYKPSFATGALAAGGTIGALIPPSILMIIYGVFAETSVTSVFMGGVSVGLLTAASYIIVIMLIAWLRKDIIPARAVGIDDLDGRKVMLAVWPILVLIVLVFGGLFSGLFTATEAGAVGAAGAIGLVAITGRLNWHVLRQSILETLGTCASLFIIGVGAVMFTRFLGLSGVAGLISGAVQGFELNYFELMFVIVVIYLILGMFMEPFGAMLVTLPVLMPVLDAQNINMVWFGVFLVKLLEIGMITPPLGMNVFVIRNVAGEYASLTDVFKGVTLFLLADLVVVTAIVAFPDIVLFLPNMLR
ncbi:TRAP transporter large permease [Devosia ginsengisoli]|uniref:TRAP transporter large permease n=1 Tax=Devosia ginsengisoli TaxID=400770 RepID=UPI0026F206D1|nr:TRAP transporter large permease [Devosia ginsengisoli]MCR6670208.1 TRAP transporter large permease [Devosia ginsengisoli]